MAPNHQFVLLSCSRAPRVASAMQSRAHRQPSAAGNSSPGDSSPTSGFLETSSPVQPEGPLRQLICHQKVKPGDGGRSRAGWFIGSTLVVPICPQKDHLLLHCRLFKGCTLTPRLCAGLFSLLFWVITQASKPVVGWWGGGHSGERGSQSPPCPSPWQPLSPWTMSTGK